jgi:hypothetical protein
MCHPGYLPNVAPPKSDWPAPAFPSRISRSILANLDANATAAAIEHLKLENEARECDTAVTDPVEPSFKKRKAVKCCARSTQRRCPSSDGYFEVVKILIGFAATVTKSSRDSIPLDIFAGPIDVWVVRVSNFSQMLDASAGQGAFTLTNPEGLATGQSVTGTQWLVSQKQFAVAATPARVMSRRKTNGSAKTADGVRSVSRIWNALDT